jgi:hypothetical protein
MALRWLPFAIVAYAVAHDPDRPRWLVSATLVFSLARVGTPTRPQWI